MKRILAFGLLVMLVIIVQSFVPKKAVPVDSDIGVCYVTQVDQDMTAMSEAAIVSEESSFLVRDVEKSRDCEFILVPTVVQYISQYDMIWQSTPARSDVNVPQTQLRFRDIGGLFPGSVFPRAGEMARHT